MSNLGTDFMEIIRRLRELIQEAKNKNTIIQIQFYFNIQQHNQTKEIPQTVFGLREKYNSLCSIIETDNRIKSLPTKRFNFSEIQIDYKLYILTKSLCTLIYQQEDLVKNFTEEFSDYDLECNSQKHKYRLLNPFFSLSVPGQSYENCMVKDTPLFFLLEKDEIYQKKSLTIVIRGTHSVWDCLSDIDAFSVNIKDFVQQYYKSYISLQRSKLSECFVHKHFLEISLKIYKIIDDFFKGRNKSFTNYQEIIICGHSMGGSVATILSLIIYTMLTPEKEVPPTSVHTQIKVLVFNPGTTFVNDKNLQLLKKDMKKNYKIYNFIFGSDPISRTNLLNLFFFVNYLFTNENLYLNSLNKFKVTINNPSNSTHLYSECRNLITVLFFLDEQDIYNFHSEDSNLYGDKSYFDSINFLPTKIDDHYMSKFPGYTCVKTNIITLREAQEFCNKKKQDPNCNEYIFNWGGENYVCRNPWRNGQSCRLKDNYGYLKKQSELGGKSKLKKKKKTERKKGIKRRLRSRKKK